MIKDYVKAKEAEAVILSKHRFFPEEITRKYKYRSDSDIDYARVIYSSAFRRLQGKMQLFIPEHIHFYRNRLTHSFEVSQIARCISKKIGLKDTFTVQTCALAHDLGNAPFGHAGEVVLNRLSDKTPYEGNAQTFRVLDHLEEKHYDHNGLNLTLRTLFGIVKYPYLKTQNSRKFLYDKDYYNVKARTKSLAVSLKTIDCEIMDLADEIAYAAHDLEDALRLKYFTINDLLYEFYNSKYKDCYDLLNSKVEKAKDFAKKSEAYQSSEEYSILFKKELTSIIIDTLIKDIDLVSKTGKIYELGFKNFKLLASGLKTLTFEAVKRNPEIYRYELLGKKVIEGLYQVYMDKKFNKELKLLPAEYREILNWERTVIDYIGGMMDSYAINQYEIYFGNNSAKEIYKKPSL